MKKYSIIGRCISWIITISALVYLVYKLITYDDYASLGQLFAQADIFTYFGLALAVILLPLQIYIELLRWQLLLRGVQNITLGESFRQVMAGYLGAFITPYRLGEYPARLLQAGLDESLVGSTFCFRSFLQSPRKWIGFLLLTLARYVVWGCQLWAVLSFCAIPLNFTQAFIAIATYYIVLTFAPSLPAAEVPMKGGWAALIFSPFTTNTPAILIAVTIIWFINTLLPVFVAALLKKS